MSRTPKPINIGGAPAPAAEPTKTIFQGSPSPIQFDTSLMTPPAAQNSIVPAQPQARQIILSVDEIDRRGTTAENSIAAASKNILGSNKTGDLDELGKLLTDAALVSKGYDPDNASKGILGFFKNMRKAVARARTEYESAEKTIDGLVVEMDRRVALYQGQITTLDTIRAALEQQHTELGPEIEYIESGVAWMEANPPEVDPSNPLTAQKAQEWFSVIAWARTRAANLVNARHLAETMIAQVTIMKDNARGLAQTFKEFKVTTLPALRTTFGLWLINKEQEAGVKIAQTNRNMANEAMRRNAELLGRNTAAIHTEMNTPTIDNDVIVAQYDAVVNSLNTIDRIRLEAKNNNATNRPVLEAKSKELAARLAQSPRP